MTMLKKMIFHIFLLLTVLILLSIAPLIISGMIANFIEKCLSEFMMQLEEWAWDDNE